MTAQTATVPQPVAEFEVATVAADTLRASIRVSGSLVAPTASVLTSVLRTHVAAGRRYLRVDLDTAQITDTEVVGALVDAHQTISDLGGMLVFENAGPLVIDAIRDATLYVRAPL